MQKSSRSFVSRLVLPGIMVALLPLAGMARADVITTFDVSGTAIPIPPLTGTTFSGTLTIDVTSGTVTAIDVMFPGLSAFDMLKLSAPFQTSNWTVTADNSSMDALTFDFTTTMTPGSLVDFTGGTILAGQASFPPTGLIFYTGVTGSVAPVPEPSSLALLAGGLGWLGFRLARRRPLGRKPAGRRRGCTRLPETCLPADG